MSLFAKEDTLWFSTVAGARTPEEEVPVNPLPDQVNQDGWDPEESDSDLDEAETVGAAEERDDLEQESEYEDTETRRPQTSRKRYSRKKTISKIPTALSKTSSSKGTSKNEALASAITVKARLPSCDIGAVEILTFFPHHTQWAEVGLRLYRNNWVHRDVAKIQLHARGNLEQETYRKRVDSLKHQILKNGKIFFKDIHFTPSTHGHLMTAVTKYDASDYAPRDSISTQLMDAKLVDIALGVVNWPTNEDCGIVTQAIEYVYQNNLDQYTTADIPQLAHQMGFAGPVEASGIQWDQSAQQRVSRIAGLGP